MVGTSDDARCGLGISVSETAETRQGDAKVHAISPVVCHLQPEPCIASARTL